VAGPGAIFQPVEDFPSQQRVDLRWRLFGEDDETATRPGLSDTCKWLDIRHQRLEFEWIFDKRGWMI
jgi:hypothetical protein